MPSQRWLIILADCGAFAGALGIAWHLEQLRHGRVFALVAFALAFYHLVEAAFLWQAQSVPDWVYTVDLVRRGVIPLLIAVYLDWLFARGFLASVLRRSTRAPEERP